MGWLTAHWRRLRGIRPGKLRLPARPIGGRTIGEPVSGPHVTEPEPPAELPATAEFPVIVVADAQLPEAVKEHAREVLLRVADVAPRPVLQARIALSLHGDPALERPAVAKASLDVSGRPVRAHVAARHMLEAIDLLERRLRRNLEDLDELARAHRHETGTAPPGEWRHGSLPTARPEYFPRPPEERELIRRKTFALSALTPEQAAWELDTLDSDFHLFTNADTGEENVVHRRPDGTTALAQVTPAAGGKPLPFAADPAPAPVMLIDEAVEQLNLTGEPFLFFVEAQTRRGNVVYVRYDGHYGLIEPQVGA